jgi:tetratricopeptide (TPR) repeat protein
MKNIFTFLLLLVFLSGCSNDRKSFYLLKEGKAKMRLHDYHAAIEDYTKAIELNPLNAEAYFNRGKAKMFLSDNHNTKMNQMVRKATHYDKKYFIELMEVIQVEIDEAIVDYTKAIELNPLNAEAYFNRGKAKMFLSDNHNTKMNQMVRKATHYDKKYFIELMEVIQVEIDEAIVDYTKEIELNPQNAEAYFNKGKAKMFLRDYHNTKMYLTARKSSYYDKKNSIEFKEVMQVETDEAIKDYNKAIELDPKYAISYNYRGNAKVLLGDYDEAIKDYTKLIKLNPKYVEAYNNRGRAKIFLKDYHGAIQDYNKAIELDPKYAISYNNRGNAKGLLKVSLRLGTYCRVI